MTFGDPRLPERFWSKCTPEPNSGCWLWLAATIRGYGVIGMSKSKKTMLAHRFAYSALVAPIQGGLTIDHLCKTECCVNPAHMEPVSNAENVRRSTAREATRIRHAAVTHCPAGHEYTPENTYTKFQRNLEHTNRQCRACARMRTAKRRAAHRAAIGR